MRTISRAVAVSLAMVSGQAFVLAQVGTPVQLKASDAAANRYFGNAVSMSGDTLAVGAPLAPGGGISNNDGSVYLYHWNGTSWVQDQKILGPSASVGTQTDFGRTLSLSGDTLVIGARLDDSAASDAGAAYVYTRTAGVWSFQQKLTASNASANDNFGDAVGIDGDTIVVAASGADAGGTDRGSVYAFVRSGITWSQQAILPAITGAANGDKLGENGAISINGDTVAVGAPSKTSNAGAVALFSRQITTWTNTNVLASPDAGTDTAGKFGSSVALKGDVLGVGANNSSKTVATGGGAYVYRRSGGAWGGNSSGVLVVPSGLATGDNFGSSISISGDVMLVGSPGRATNTGAAYSFRYVNSAWAQSTQILAPDAAVGDFFGYSVTLDGDVAAIGAQSDDYSGLTDAGSAWVFSRESGQWIGSEFRMAASDAAANNAFGVSVAIDGDIAISGSNQDTVTVTKQGAAFLLVRDGLRWKEQARVVSQSSQANEGFGRAVAISGTTALVGVPNRANGANANQGAAFAYVQSGATWPVQQFFLASDGAANNFFGGSVGISGDVAVVGAFGYGPSVVQQGTAYVFTRSGVSWFQAARIEASDKAANDLFGYSVAISGDTIVCGAYNKNAQVGAAYVFERYGNTWRQTQKLTANDGAAGDCFGVSVAIKDKTIVVGAFNKTINGNAGQGAAYVFTKGATGTWSQVNRLTAQDGAPSDAFGFSVSISQTNVVVGAYNARVPGANAAGVAYLFPSVTGLTTGPWVGSTTKFVPAGAAANDFFGYATGVSGNTMIGGAYGASSTAGRVSFFDFADAQQVAMANLSTQQISLGSLSDFISTANNGGQIVATGGAFSPSSLDFDGKILTLASRSSVALNSSAQMLLSAGDKVNAAPGSPMNLYGNVRTSNDSGQSTLNAGSVRQGSTSSINIGDHELVISASTINLEGRTSLLNTKSALTAIGAVNFKGIVSDLAGGRISSTGGMGFDGTVNLKGSTISAGGPVTIETNTNMNNVTIASPANVVTGGGRWVVGGTIMGPVTNSGKIITAGATSIYGSIINNTGAAIDLTGGATSLYGSVSGGGSLTGSFTGCPTCIGLPVGLKIESDLSFSEGGGLSITGGSVEVGRSFSSSALDSKPFNMLSGGLRLSNSGNGDSTFEAMSHDYGPAGAALHLDIDSSFPLGTLEVGPNATVLNLVDQFDNDARGQNSREAIYVENLIVDAGSRLNTGGVKVYARYATINGTVDNVNNIVTLGGRCDSDLKIDALVDDGDFQLFISAYDISDCSDAAMPRLGGGGCRADLNLDGMVDDADFQIFVVAYDQLVCD
ncbi:MAG: hypothetical protein U0570_13760 [Phycisphaerales bacterium]